MIKKLRKYRLERISYIPRAFVYSDEQEILEIKKGVSNRHLFCIK